MLKRKTLYQQILHYLLLLLIALAFAALFHFCISPVMTEMTEFDVSCFQVIGNAMRSGKMPYLNFIDNKGPVVYFVYMLSSLIDPFPWGIFVFSVILDFCSLVLLERICQRLRIRHPFWILLLFLFFYVCVCSNGGLTEDFSIPLTMAAFLIYLDFDEQLKNSRLRLINGFLLGLLFWLSAFTRINNALPIGLITASIGVQLLLKKEYKQLAAFVGMFAAGSVLLVLPVVLWLTGNGAFHEFLTQFLINNFKYSSSEIALPKAELFFHRTFGIAFFLLIIECIVGVLQFYRNCGKPKLSILVTTLVVLLGTGLSFLSVIKAFLHYLNVILVPVFFGFILQFAYPPDKQEKNKNRKFLAIFATCACCFIMTFAFSVKVKVGGALVYGKAITKTILAGTLFEKTEYEKTIDRLAERIPVDERDSVFSIDADAKFYAYSGITPCKRMFACTTLFTSISKEYHDEFVSYFLIDPPKWLFTDKPMEALELCVSEKDILSSYSLDDDTSGYFYLYKRSVTDETH